MEAGLGIGGLAVGKDEVASSAFDLFSPIEIEHSIEKSSKLTVRPIAKKQEEKFPSLVKAGAGDPALKSI